MLFKRSQIVSILVMLTTLLSCNAFATGYDDYFVKPQWLKDNLDANLVIIDARGEKAYASGHIPGARPVSWKQLSDMTPQFSERNWGTVSSKEILENTLSALGVDGSSNVIIYADTKKGWGEDGRVFWTLKIAGLTQLRILDGGIAGWKKIGGKLTKAFPVITPTHFVVESLNLTSSIDTDALISEYHLYKIIDTRAKDEFEGAVKFGEKRGGHMPGALHIAYSDFLRDGMLKPLDEIELMLKAKDLQKSDRIVTYCTAGIRSAYFQVVMEMLGYTSVLNYDESFYIWANEPNTPIGKVVKKKPYVFLTPSQLEARIELENSPILIDIQPVDEFAKHHIDGAIETAAYPVKTDQDIKLLEATLPMLKESHRDIAIICPRGAGGARRTVDYLQRSGIAASRIHILEGGQAAWKM